MSETRLESQPEVESAPAAAQPKGPLSAPRALPPVSFNEPADQPQDGGEVTASTPPDDTLLDTDCEVITIGHARFYLRYADWLPPLAEDEFNGLTESIREHGIQQPVVLYRLLNNHFDVIDGLHRLKVAQALGFDLMQIPLNILDQATNVKEQKALAWSLNADRRHLTKEQRQARALELRKEGLSYRAIGEQLGTSQMTARSDVQEATVKNFTVDLPERVVGKDGKSRPAVAPPPTKSEVDIAREFIIDALRRKYSPLARGQLYRDASRIAGASGIKRKAFDAALDAMLEAGSVREHINPHGAREYHFADIVDRLDVVSLSLEFKTRILDLLSTEPRGYPELRMALDIETTDAPRMAALRRTLDLLLEEELIRKSAGRYYLAESEAPGVASQGDPDATPAPVDDELARFLRASVPFVISAIRAGKHRTREELNRMLEIERASAQPRKTMVDFLTTYYIPGPLPSESDGETPAAATVADELRARFDQDAFTLAGHTDDGARHRGIEIARKLVAAGIWNGRDWIEFDAYALHDKLFGVNPVAPEDLVEDEDYWFVGRPAEQGDEPAAAEEIEPDGESPDVIALSNDLAGRILDVLAAGAISYPMLRYALQLDASDPAQISGLRRALDMLFGEQRIRKAGDRYMLAGAEGDEFPWPADTRGLQPYDTYHRFAVAARAIVNYLPGIRAGQDVDWDDVDDQQRAQARELLDELVAVAADLPILLSEISQKLGAA